MLNNESVYYDFGLAYALSTSSAEFRNNQFINCNNLAFGILGAVGANLAVYPFGYNINYSRIRKKIGYAKLNHNEMKNRGFINARPIVFMVCGTMGKKKTTTITDMALSQEVMFRDKAFEKILENDLKFPFFPWINFENEIKRAMKKHEVYNLATCRKFVAKCAKKWRKKKTRKNIFDYDFNRYGLTYDDKLKVVDIWKVLETYDT